MSDKSDWRWSRRATFAAPALLAGAFPAAATQAATSKPKAGEVEALVRRANKAAASFMAGDMDTWLTCVAPVPSDFTLMQPFGGPASRGFDPSREHLDRMASFFRNGDGSVEIVETYATADMIVLVMMEHQHGEVGGLPDQQWPLRVTQVYRRRGDGWEIVHRHADPMAKHVGLETAAALART